MSDLLVKLYGREYVSRKSELLADGITIKKACVIDRDVILKFVRENFSAQSAWANECEYALFNNPVTCHIAVKDKEVVGFSCYDVVAKGFFGPTGVKESVRGKGVGRELLLSSLASMKESGYGYAIIGWVADDTVAFYKKHVDAVVIDDSPPNKSVYKNTVSQG